MGTSQSSGGPGPGVPMVPPWTPPLPPAPPPSPNPEESPQPQPAPPAPQLEPTPLAPPARFIGVRRSLGDYSRTGNGDDLRRSLGHYVRSGYGGAQAATRRFGGTARTALALGSTLNRLAEGADSDLPIDKTILAGRSAQEVMDALVEAVRPVDGTQDAEAERAAIRDALSDLLTRFPDADLLNLDPSQREFAIERFTAFDVIRRFELDMSKTVFERAPSTVAAVARLKEIRDYIKEAVSASFRQLRQRGTNTSSGRVASLVRDALQATFEVFEGYLA